MTAIFRLPALVLGCALMGAFCGSAAADKIKHPTAVFAGLDKITGRIISFEVAIDETVQFGSLQITPRVCYSRPATDAPRTDAFAEVTEVQADKSQHRIFNGWMFADSPGLHGIEHPVYDLWLTDCKGDGPLIKEAPEVADAPLDDTDPAAAPATPATDATDNPVAKPPPKKRPKPRPTTASAPTGQSPDSPLELNSANVGGRSGPIRRFFPTDAAPIPPGNVGQ